MKPITKFFISSLIIISALLLLLENISRHYTKSKTQTYKYNSVSKSVMVDGHFRLIGCDLKQVTLTLTDSILIFQTQEMSLNLPIEKIEKDNVYIKDTEVPIVKIFSEQAMFMHNDQLFVLSKANFCQPINSILNQPN